MLLKTYTSRRTSKQNTTRVAEPDHAVKPKRRDELANLDRVSVLKTVS